MTRERSWMDGKKQVDNYTWWDCWKSCGRRLAGMVDTLGLKRSREQLSNGLTTKCQKGFKEDQCGSVRSRLILKAESGDSKLAHRS